MISSLLLLTVCFAFINTVDKNTIDNKQLSDFITEKSKGLIIAQNINLNFLNKDPSLWEEDTEFIKSRDQIKKLKVIMMVLE